MDHVMKILIVRTSSLGDIFHAFPAVARLKEAEPGLRIHWLVSPKFASLIEPVQEIERIHCPGPLGRIGDRLEFIRRLRQEDYDAVIDFQGLFRTGIWDLATGCRRRIGFSRREARQKFNCLFTNIHVTPDMKDRHVVQKNLRLLQPLGITGEPSRVLTYRIAESTQVRVQKALRKTGLRAGEPFIGIHIGASLRYSTKCWPLGHFNRLLSVLDARHKILILWGPDESEKIRSIRPGRNVFIAPAVSLLEMAAILQACSLVVGSDSGAVHMAAAFGVPTLCLMGPTSPDRSRPWGTGHRYLHQGLSCRGCLKNWCIRKGRCMNGIDPGDTASMVESMRASV